MGAIAHESKRQGVIATTVRRADTSSASWVDVTINYFRDKASA